METQKIKFGVLVIITFLLYFNSCSQDKKGWSEQDKKAFVKSCVKSSNRGHITKEMAQEMCECMLNKVVAKYPTMEASKKMKQEAKKMALSCFEEIKNTSSSLMFYKTKGGEVGFYLNFWQELQETNFDLQCTDGNAYMSVFVHKIEDFKAGKSKKDILDMYIKNITSKRKNVKKEEALKEIKSGTHTIYQVIYTADIDENRNMYSFNVIDFGEDSDVFVFVLFSAVTSYAEESMQKWNDILKTAKILK